MRTLALLLLVGCGPVPAGELELGTAPIAPPASAAASAPSCAPEARCYCCWPAKFHGPGRCRFARAACAPADPCELDPEQRCEGTPGL